MVLISMVIERSNFEREEKGQHTTDETFAPLMDLKAWHVFEKKKKTCIYIYFFWGGGGGVR
jgi:hypothetical protein